MNVVHDVACQNPHFGMRSGHPPPFEDVPVLVAYLCGDGLVLQLVIDDPNCRLMEGFHELGGVIELVNPSASGCKCRDGMTLTTIPWIRTQPKAALLGTSGSMPQIGQSYPHCTDLQATLYIAKVNSWHHVGLPGTETAQMALLSCTSGSARLGRAMKG